MTSLTKSISLTNFKNYYWLKSELIKFSRKNGLSTLGSKQELAKRIEIFLKTGKKIKFLSKKIKTNFDSKKLITRNTLVINYKNDAATRKFFVEQIGSRFHFNSYLRKFTKKQVKSLTYGDLVDGWLAVESHKKDKNFKTTIGKQFEYNQFTRDFFANEKGKTRADAIKAWKIVKSIPGKNSYAHYKEF